jgi:hypothetical protein
MPWVNNPGTSPTFTSPGSPGAFLFPSASPCNRPAQAPACPLAGGLAVALPFTLPAGLPGFPALPCRPAGLPACRLPCLTFALSLAVTAKPSGSRARALFRSILGNRMTRTLPGCGAVRPLPFPAAPQGSAAGAGIAPSAGFAAGRVQPARPGDWRPEAERGFMNLR